MNDKLEEAIEKLKWLSEQISPSPIKEAIDTVVAHLTSENKRDLDDSLRDKAVEQPENKDNTSHKLDKKYETYRPFWEEMKEEILSRDPYPSPEFDSELQSILIRAYMQALEVGFNEGWKFSLDQLMNIVDRSTFSVEVKETMRQMIAMLKENING